MTINITTGQEYTGQNAEALEGYEAVCTFKQGIKHYGVSGKQVAGLKAVARLVRFRMVEDDDGNSKKMPVYFSVFNADDFAARAKVKQEVVA
tara:strand:- start:1108 stop:1383 length:276 start_codon:yes stop_codon:yes gene_type:complete